MSTIVKLIIAMIVAVIMSSCNFNVNFGEGIEGNGNVISQERSLNKSFNAIKASRGLEVYITQGTTEQLSVNADENLHAIINTEVTDGVLEIWSEKNIKTAAAKRILVTVKTIEQLKTSSGAYLYSDTALQANTLKLISSSGSHIDLIANATTIRCKSSSGAGITISGQTDTLNARSSSGSYIKASDLITKVAHAKASSGSNIYVHASEKMFADTSSGANITYTGHPDIVHTDKGVSGTISSM